MSNLFKLQFQSFIKNRLAKTDSFRDIQEGLYKLQKGYIPKSKAILYRLPRSELKSLAKLECPIQIDPTSKKIKPLDKQIMVSSKLLREFLKVQEKQACSQCQQRMLCNFKDREHSTLNTTTAAENEKDKEASSIPTFLDIQNILLGIYMRSLQQSTNLIEGVKDEENTQPAADVIIEQQSFKKDEAKKVNPNLKDFNFQDYNSASIILTNIDLIYKDLIENNGIQYKMFINEASKQGDSLQELKQGSSDLALRQPDNIDTLIEKIDQSRNRKERRKLLASYNQTQELVWGQASSIAKISQKNTASVPSIVDTQNKVYNKATNSFVDKEIYDKCLKQEKINPNSKPGTQKKLTQVLSKNQKLHSINNYDRTKKFEFKVNLENEKQRQLFREQMAQRNQFKSENFAMIEAIEEGKRVAAYFENEDQAKKFIMELKNLKEEQKESYGLKEIEEKSMLSRSKSHKVIPTREELSQQALFGSVQNKMVEGNSEQNGQQENLIEDDVSQKQLESGDPQQKPAKIAKKEVSELERSAVSSVDQFVVSKAKPIDNTPEKAQANQKRKILNYSIDDRYIAENYYQNSMDELLYEKDGAISKMKQFNYKIHKFKKNKSSSK